MAHRADTPSLARDDAAAVFYFDGGLECRVNEYGLRFWIRNGRQVYDEIPPAAHEAVKAATGAVN